MEVKDILLELRKKNNLTQDELAEKAFVTRQAVSRWETGETTPNVDTLGSPRRLICQCCGMPLDDGTTSREPDGAFNEEYCKWCYTDGTFVYTDLGELVDFLVGHTANENWPAESARKFYEEQLPKLNHWKK